MHRVLFLFLVLVPFAWSTEPVKVHVPPPYHLDTELQEGKLVTRLSIFSAIYQEWFGIDAPPLSDETAPATAAEAQAILDKLDDKAPVWIDGVRVRPEVVGLRRFMHRDERTGAALVHYVEVILHHKVLKAPRSIRWRWLRFETGDGYDIDKVMIFFFPDDESSEMVTLVPAEPEYAWHAPSLVREKGVALRSEGLGGKSIRLPLLSLALLLVGAIGAVSFRHRPKVLWPAIMVAALGAFLTRDLAVNEVAILRAEPLPDSVEAREIFGDLHANVYRAFDYENESEVYDALARSVDGALLETLYDQIYSDLVMREDGGAVARIHSVKILEDEIIVPEGTKDARFDVRARWLVRGIVEHFGHKHLRTTEYRARYALSRRGTDWRISDVTMEEQKRVGDDEAFFERGK